jgi:phosphoglycolate phosphatase
MMYSKRHIVFDCDGTLVDTSRLKYSLYPGIKELLLALSSESVLYVWTARDRRSTLRILDELGISKFFEQISTCDDAIPKPHVSGLIDMLHDTNKSMICVIGDTSNDIIGAKNFNVKSIGAAWNPNAGAIILKESGADFIANAPEECLEWIKENLVH